MNMPRWVRRFLFFLRSIVHPLLRVIRSVLGWDGSWWVAGIIAVLLIGVLLSWRFWDELGDDRESLSTTIRNVGLVIGGIIAILLAVWRSTVAERQADTAQQSLLNERYERGAEMLGSDVLSARLGGIYSLQRLASEYPHKYHIQVMQLFCAFVRNPTRQAPSQVEQQGNEEERTPQLREDVQAVIAALGGRGELGIAMERREKLVLDLHGADLSFARLSGASLAGADLSHANLRQASFFDTTPSGPDLSTPIPSGPNQPPARIGIPGSFIPWDFSGVEGRRANLSGSVLNGANLSDAFLLGTDLSGAQIVGAILSNSQLIRANLRLAVLLSADLSGAFLLSADLSGVQLAHANLAGTQLPSAKLYGANLFMTELQEADLSDALFSDVEGEFIATGLTQKQLDQAKANPNSPPNLTGIVDYSTGEPLIWRGSACGPVE